MWTLKNLSIISKQEIQTTHAQAFQWFVAASTYHVHLVKAFERKLMLFCPSRVLCNVQLQLAPWAKEWDANE